MERTGPLELGHKGRWPLGLRDCRQPLGLMLFLPSAGRLPYLLLPPTSLWAVQGQEPLSPAPHSATTPSSWQRPALRSPPAPCWSLDPESHGHLPGPHALSDRPCPCLQCLGLPPLTSLNSLALLPLTPSPSPAPFPVLLLPRPPTPPPPPGPGSALLFCVNPRLSVLLSLGFLPVSPRLWGCS